MVVPKFWMTHFEVMAIFNNQVNQLELYANRWVYVGFLPQQRMDAMDGASPHETAMEICCPYGACLLCLATGSVRFNLEVHSGISLCNVLANELVGNSSLANSDGIADSIRVAGFRLQCGGELRRLLLVLRIWVQSQSSGLHGLSALLSRCPCPLTYESLDQSGYPRATMENEAWRWYGMVQKPRLKQLVILRINLNKA